MGDMGGHCQHVLTFAVLNPDVLLRRGLTYRKQKAPWDWTSNELGEAAP